MSVGGKAIITAFALICTIVIVSIFGLKAEKPTMDFVARCEAQGNVPVKGYYDWVCVKNDAVTMVDNDRRE